MARQLSAEGAGGGAAAQGHNGNLDEDKFLEHLRAMIRANEALEAAKNARKAVRKLAKAAGIELKKADATITMMDWEPGEVRAHFGTTAQYARWAKLPVGTQLDMFAPPAPEAPKPEAQAAEDWYTKGYALGIKGKDCVTPEGCPPENVPDVTRGWHDAQEKLARSIKPLGNA